MPLYEDILKAAKAEGYTEEETRKAIESGLGQLFERTKAKGIDDEVVKAKLDTFGMPKELYNAPENAGQSVIEKAQRAVPALEDAAKTAATATGQAASAAAKGMVEAPQRAAAGISGVVKAAEAGLSKGRPTQKPKQEEAKSPLQQVIEDLGIKAGVTMAKDQMDKVYGPTAGKYLNAFASGAPAAVADLARGAQFLGFDAAGVVADRARQIENELSDPKQMDTAQGVLKQAGYLGTLYIPGLGVEAAVEGGTAKAAAAIPRLATWLGVPPSSVAEAMAKAGQVYMDTIGKIAPKIAAATGASEEGVIGTLSTVRALPAEKIAGQLTHVGMAATINAGAVYERSLKALPQDKELANQRASAVFWGSLPVSLIASHFFPGGNGGMMQQAFQGALSQGSVVASWHMLSNMAMADPVLSGTLHAFANGAIFGGVTGAFAGALNKTTEPPEGVVVEPREEPPSMLQITAEGEAPKGPQPGPLIPEPPAPAASEEPGVEPVPPELKGRIAKGEAEEPGIEEAPPEVKKADLQDKLAAAQKALDEYDAEGGKKNSKKRNELQRSVESVEREIASLERPNNFAGYYEKMMGPEDFKALAEKFPASVDIPGVRHEFGSQTSAVDYGSNPVPPRSQPKERIKALEKLLPDLKKEMDRASDLYDTIRTKGTRDQGYYGSGESELEVAEHTLDHTRTQIEYARGKIEAVQREIDLMKVATGTAPEPTDGGLTLKPRYGVEGSESVENGGQWGDVVKGSAKAQFKNDSAKYLKAVGARLGLEGKPSFNPAGPASSGDASITLLGKDGKGVYITIGESSVDVPNRHAQGLAIMYRAASKKDPYGAKAGQNNWISASAGSEELAQAIRSILPKKSGTEQAIEELKAAAEKHFDRIPVLFHLDEGQSKALTEKLDSIPRPTRHADGSKANKQYLAFFDDMKAAIYDDAINGKIPKEAVQEIIESGKIKDSSIYHITIETPNWYLMVGRNGMMPRGVPEVSISNIDLVNKAKAIEPKEGTSITPEAIARFVEVVKQDSARANSVRGDENYQPEKLDSDLVGAIEHFTDPAEKVIEEVRAWDQHGPPGNYDTRAVMNSRGEKFLEEAGWPIKDDALYRNIHTRTLDRYGDLINPDEYAVKRGETRDDQVWHVVEHYEPVKAEDLESERKRINSEIKKARKALKTAGKKQKPGIVSTLDGLDKELVDVEKAINSGANKFESKVPEVPVDEPTEEAAPVQAKEESAPSKDWKKAKFQITPKEGETAMVSGQTLGDYGVHRAGRGKSAEWSVTHLKSGLRISFFPEEKLAKRAAERLATEVPALGQMEVDQVKGDKEIGPKVLAIVNNVKFGIEPESESQPGSAEKPELQENTAKEAPYAGVKATPGSRLDAENDGEGVESVLEETETGVSHMAQEVEAIDEMLKSGVDEKGKPLKPARIKQLEGERTSLQNNIDDTLAQVEMEAGDEAAEKMRKRTGQPSQAAQKKDLKVRKTRAKLDVEGEANHGEQFEVQDNGGEVVVRPEDGPGEGGQDSEGEGGQVRRSEPPKRPGGGGAPVPADAVPDDTRLSVEKPIELTPKQRESINEKALKVLEKSTDQITAADREILRQYTGLGGLQAEEEGVLNQHYTSYRVIDFMWKKLGAIGVQFKGAKALEAAEGVGNFLGFKPAGIDFDAVELDERASKIASILYPSVKHHNMPFEKFVPSYGYDISIGNDPFGNFRGKERYADEAAVYQDIESIHDFFIVKRIDLLNPNGVLAVITSTGTMDKKDPKVRAKINAKAEFLGAYRLPQGTFKKNAGFEGSVDILFFRKRVAEEIGKKELLQKEFLETQAIPLKGTGDYDQNVWINSYFVANPQKVFGRLIAGGRYANRAEAKLTGTLQEHLARVLNDDIKLVPKATKVAKSQGGYIEDQPNFGDAPQGSAVGSYVMKDKKLLVVGASGKLFDSGKQVRALPKVKAALDMMELADKLMAGARENGTIDKTAQKALLRKAQAYFKEHKQAPGYDRSLASLRDDVRYFKLAGIMDDEGKPADILTKDSIFPENKKIKPAKKGDLADAIRYAKDHGKGSDFRFIAETYGKPVGVTGKELVEKHGWNMVLKPGEGTRTVEKDGKIKFEGPDAFAGGEVEFIPDSDYLVGDLWPKIDQAQADGFPAQVEKLKKALPEQKTIENVPASLLQAWLPQSARDGFLAYAGIGGKFTRKINAQNGRLEWAIEGGAGGSLPELKINGNTPAQSILKYLNHEKEYMPDPEDYRNRILDRAATEKLKEVDKVFEKYLRTESPKDQVVDAYNRAYRSYKRRAPDSTPAELPGISSTFKGRPLVVKSHQWEWVHQATEIGASINAHGVGGGKTMAGALAGQLASVKRGAKRKLYIVPAKVIQKWAYEIQQLFPGAKVFSLEDLSSNNAYKMLQQVAMNDFDYALISHDRLKMIPLKSAEKYLLEDLGELRNRLLQMKQSKGRKNLKTERDIQERLVKMEEKLRGLQQMAKTKTIWWEDLGIDLISVDEAHNYKRVNVDYGTYAAESHISGGNQSSDRANDLWYKTREMRDRKKGNIHFLTATPTTNRPIEIYSMIRFLNPEEWTSRGIMNAQDFIDHFATIEDKLVPDLDGVMVAKTLITGYKNLHDLRSIVGKYVDFRPIADLKEVVRPEGSYTIVEVPISKDQQRILAKIVADLEFVQRNPKAAQAEGINKMSLTTAGRQAAVGADIYDAEQFRNWEEKNSKIAFVIDKVSAIHKEKGAGQLIFLDMFRGYKKVPKLSKEDKAAMEAAGTPIKLEKPEVLVNYHEKIRDLLVKRGIKASDIAIVNGEVNNTPAAKQKVSEDYNAGRLKVVIGTTTSMGEGMDLQADTVAIHNMDVPWTPAALEQRNGRGLRQGNKNELVDIFYYQTKGSLDAFMFGKLAVKDNWNTNLWLGKDDTMSNNLNNDEVEGVDYEDLAKNLAVDRATLDYWKKVREADIERGLQAERAKQIENLEHRIKIRHEDIGYSQTQLENNRQRLQTDPTNPTYQDRITAHTDNIQTVNVEIQKLQQELDKLKQEQDAGKAKLEVPAGPDAAPAAPTAKPEPRSLGSAAAQDFEGQEPPPDTLQPTVNEDPAGVDRALGAAAPPPPPKKGEKPGRGFTFSSEEQEKRYQAARKGISAPTLIQRMTDFLRETWASMTTEIEGLPKDPAFAKARFELHRVQKQSAVAEDTAIRLIEGIIRPMDDVDLDLFQRVILLRDLAREDKAEHDLPFGFEAGDPDKELERLQPILEARERAFSGIARRQSVWDGIKADYIKAMADIGFNVADRLKSEDYFRHQVLLYANGGKDFRVRGTGRGLHTPTSRGFLKRRVGSELDINANYAQAEFEVMAQMLKDIEIAKAIRKIKDAYDISKDLKAKAKAMNQAAMEQVMKSEQPVKMIGLDAVGQTELQMRQYGQNIAYGFKLVYQAINNGEIPPDLAQKWADTISTFESQATAADMDDTPGAPEAVRPTDPNVFKFLAELANTDGPGAMGARIVFKTTTARRQFIKQTLGDNYQEWKDIVPDSHRLWQPREGNVFYFVDTVPAKLAQQIHNKIVESVGLTQADLGRALSMGGLRAEWAIPAQLADALDSFNSPMPESRFGEALKYITGKWKQWQLISPRRVFRYNIRNMSGDADAAFVGNPDTFRHVPDALRELMPAFFSMKDIEGDLREFFVRGGFETTLRAQEVADLKDVELLSRLFEQKDKTIADKGLDAFKKVWNASALATDFRETILRYAAFKSFLTQLQPDPVTKAPGQLKSYGASIKEDIDALDNIHDKAFKLANDLLGAYDEVSVLGQWLRTHLFPFWSWKEVNMRRYIQLFKNSAADGVTSDSMKRFIGATSAKFAARAAAFLIKATAAWVMMELYNHLVWPKEESELDAYNRNRAHLILWREADGKVAYFTGLGALGDALSWFGADAAPLMARDFLEGKRTALEVAKEIGKAPFNIVAQAITPLIKMPAELAAQKQFFPDVFSPKPIRDNAQYLFRSLALGDEYNSLFGVPSRGYLDSMKNLFYYRMDPGQGAFLDIETLKQRFMERNGLSHDGGSTTPKGQALYLYKQALRYDDKELAGRYLKQWITLGGKPAQMKESLINMGPLAGLSSRDKARFLSTLNQDDRIRLANAQHYWSEILLGRRKE